jgi:hypothetical protein
MKLLVYPDQSVVGNQVLNGYVLSEPWSSIPTTPDFYVDCGHAWFGSSFNPDFVVGESRKIYCINNGSTIVRFTPPLASSNQAEELYQHNTWIRRLALRMVMGSSGVETERLYFSAPAPTAADESRTQIYWLDQNGTVHPYLSIGANELQVPDPCQPKQDLAIGYAGDFTFDKQTTLYLSNGNSGPCGIFKITGALPDSISGTPQRIFVTDSYCISDLQHDGQGGLLFTDYTTNQADLPYRLRRFDLNTASTQIIWNKEGNQFRGFAVDPVRIEFEFLRRNLKYMKRFKIGL